MKHESDVAEVTNVHEAGVREVGDLIREGEMLAKCNNAKVAQRQIGGESERWSWRIRKGRGFFFI